MDVGKKKAESRSGGGDRERISKVLPYCKKRRAWQWRASEQQAARLSMYLSSLPCGVGHDDFCLVGSWLIPALSPMQASHFSLLTLGFGGGWAGALAKGSAAHTIAKPQRRCGCWGCDDFPCVSSVFLRIAHTPNPAQPGRLSVMLL